jgi:hypothetical protein
MDRMIVRSGLTQEEEEEFRDRRRRRKILCMQRGTQAPYVLGENAV